MPFKKGCDYCSKGVKEEYTGFYSLKDVADHFLADLQMISGDISKITISGGGDPSCYPEFTSLIEILGSLNVPLHIGYTSGKGFDDVGIADFMIKNNMKEVSFTIFASDPTLREKYMHDPTPQASLDIMERLAAKIDVYAALVLLAEVNDGEVLWNTLRWLEKIGVKGVILMRFANRENQGLILDNAPVIENQRVHTVDEFREIVRDAAARFPKLRISATPLYDPAFDSPFAIRNEPDLLRLLPRITGRASVITGSIAAPFIAEILGSCGAPEGMVVPVDKEISCLITIDDLNKLDHSLLEETVIIPGRAFVHDPEAEIILDRRVIRGPETLSADGETSMGMDLTGVLAMEMEGFTSLIQIINQYGRIE